MQTEASNIIQKTDVDKLPSLPHVLLRLLALCHDESISYEQLADILRKDPSLYLKMMSICHQQCQDSEKPQPPEQILSQLGLNTIKSVAVTSAAQQFFSRYNHERSEFIKQHWQHSLLCASIAEAIAVHLHYPQPNDAYGAGLLHDIGQLSLESAFPDKYTTTFAALSEDDNFHDLELESFATTHQEVGAALLRKHNINPFVVDAVLYHHEPVDSLIDAHPLVKIIHLANQLANNDFKPEDSHIFAEAETLFGFERSWVLDLLSQSRDRVASTASKLEIDLRADGMMEGETAKRIKAREEYKQLQLAEQIRNIAMLDGVHQHLSRIDGEKQLLQAIEQHVGILFSINRCILFLYDPEDDQLRALASDKLPARLDEFRIRMETSHSMVATAVLNKQAEHSFEKNITALSVIDRQLIGLTEREGIICLPMIMNDTAVGTLVLGVDAIQHQVLWKQLGLLDQFASGIAHTISAIRGTGRIGHPKEAPNAASYLLESHVREVVHEVRNPLSIMNNYLEILGYKLEADHPAQADLKTIKGEIQRASSILERLSQPSPLAEESALVDINALISDLTLVFQTSICAANNIQIKLDLDDRIKPLMSNANGLKQIYTNLIKNAVEALPANGQIMVYTQDYVNVGGKEHIEISIFDDGPGINPEKLPKLFSPVETQKGTDHAGLGLTIVKNLVNELHGSISCKSSKKGTSFHILLPKK
jgi:putative nucleotidyltransferase with HDIG domain